MCAAGNINCGTSRWVSLPLRSWVNLGFYTPCCSHIVSFSICTNATRLSARVEHGSSLITWCTLGFNCATTTCPGSPVANTTGLLLRMYSGFSTYPNLNRVSPNQYVRLRLFNYGNSTAHATVYTNCTSTPPLGTTSPPQTTFAATTTRTPRNFSGVFGWFFVGVGVDACLAGETFSCPTNSHRFGTVQFGNERIYAVTMQSSASAVYITPCVGWAGWFRNVTISVYATLSSPTAVVTQTIRCGAFSSSRVTVFSFVVPLTAGSTFYFGVRPTTFQNESRTFAVNVNCTASTMTTTTSPHQTTLATGGCCVGEIFFVSRCVR